MGGIDGENGESNVVAATEGICHALSATIKVGFKKLNHM
jgi:hypothetical protein